MYAIGGVLIASVVIGVLIYFFVFAEKRNYPNTTAQQNLNFLTETFEGTRPMTTRLQDFDVFKYSGYDVKSPLYTYTNNKSSSNPYNNIITSSANQSESLNATILPGDIAVEVTEPSFTTPAEAIEVSTPSLSGLNAGTEASIRESMIRTELRRLRR